MEQLDREVLLDEVQASLDDYGNCGNLTDENTNVEEARCNFDRLYSDMKLAFVDSHDGTTGTDEVAERAFEAIPAN